MEEIKQTTGEIKQTNFRLNSEDADKFRKYCEENGLNHAQGFQHMMSVMAADKAKGALPDREQEISDFELHAKALLDAYLKSLEINVDTRALIREEFALDLTRKDKTIDELREKKDQLELNKNEIEAALKEALLNVSAAEEREKNAINQAISAKKSADDQEKINTMLSAKLAEAEEKLTGYADLKAAEQEAGIEIQKLKQTILDLKKDYAAEINALKKDADLEKERAIAKKERELLDQVQAAELKTATLLGKLEEKEARIKELSSSQQH